MAQSVGEFFVNLGVKGSDKTINALKGIGDQIKGLGSFSLESKVAIVGMMYALEQLFSKSGAAGTSLKNFTALTGDSAKTLQQYQYAGRQVKVSNEEMASTFVNLQSLMAKMRAGKGAPEGWFQIAMLTGMQPEDAKKFEKHPELLMQKLQEYAQKEKNIGFRNIQLRSFVPENIISGMARNAFTPEILKRAPTYSDKEIDALDRANIAWSNLNTKIEMAVGHFNARHGQQLVTDIDKMVDGVLKFVEALEKIAEVFHIFEKMGKFFEILANGLNAIAGTTDKGAEQIGKAGIGGRPGLGEQMWGGLKLFGGDLLRESIKMIAPPSPTMPAASPGGKAGATTVNQTNNFHNVKEPHDLVHSVKQAAKTAFRQSPAQQWAT